MLLGAIVRISLPQALRQALDVGNAVQVVDKQLTALRTRPCIAKLQLLHHACAAAVDVAIDS